VSCFERFEEDETLAADENRTTIPNYNSLVFLSKANCIILLLFFTFHRMVNMCFLFGLSRAPGPLLIMTGAYLDIFLPVSILRFSCTC
jgi:hypothetical protein